MPTTTTTSECHFCRAFDRDLGGPVTRSVRGMAAHEGCANAADRAIEIFATTVTIDGIRCHTNHQPVGVLVLDYLAALGLVDYAEYAATLDTRGREDQPMTR